MKIIQLLLLLGFLFFNSLVFSQHENIMIVNVDGPNEPTIAIDPNNTNRLIGGSNLNFYFYSDDGGYTWQYGVLTSASLGVWGDPVTMVDNNGHYYFFHLSNPPSGNWIDRIVCQKSTDGGVTWNEGTYMGLNGTKAQDKHWVIIDRNNGNIYVTWTQFDSYGSSNPSHRSNIMFSKSTDGGMTWSPALRINEVDGDCIDSDNTVEGSVPAVGPNGEIYASWSGPSGLVFDKSLDQGETWLENDIFISDLPGGWDIAIPGIYRANGFPVTVCDLSGGPNHGTIYINWSDQRNGEDDTDVWLIKSTDGGETWSERKRVNNDPPGNQQFFTWMTIDQVTGYLHVVFYDRRNYTDNQTDVYMAVSKDGGNTFFNYKVSEEPFIPNSWIFFGDYNNVTAHDNVIRPVWTRMHDGQRSIMTAIIDSQILSVENAQTPVIPFALEQNYPNPFYGSTGFSFRLKRASTISLKIFDLFGREVATLVDDEYRFPGNYTVHFDSRAYQLSPGVYYFSLSGNEVNQVRKMIIER
ncbi:MAG: T9SS type A sorting domain-containing protein [Bacteroidales bacterium]|nr:T9SS type A sorting domain-containing protein [Bacteroidales bacterium]